MQQRMVLLDVDLAHVYLKRADLSIFEHSLPNDLKEDPPVLCLLLGELLGLEEEMLVENRDAVLVDLLLGRGELSFAEALDFKQDVRGIAK